MDKNHRKVVRGLAAWLWLGCTAWSGGALAQSAGSNVVSVGWLHVMPQAKGSPLTVTDINGQPVNIELTGSGSGAKTADTLGITFEHYLTDQIGLKLVAGWPTDLTLVGHGTLKPYGTLGKAQPWSPALLASYHFGAAQSRFRPFASLGVTYTWFEDARITNQQFVTDNLGSGGSITVDTTDAWKPVAELGANYALADHWALGLVLSYSPVRTDAILHGRTATGVTTTTRATIRLRPITSLLDLSYSF